MNFVCVDVETATESSASICQIGVATFIEGVHQADLDIETFINPESHFLPELTALHGISQNQVDGAPIFAQVYPALLNVFEGRAVLAHSPFDRVSLKNRQRRSTACQNLSRAGLTLCVSQGVLGLSECTSRDIV